MKFLIYNNKVKNVKNNNSLKTKNSKVKINFKWITRITLWNHFNNLIINAIPKYIIPKVIY